MPLNEIVRIARPGHWVKNIVVFFPVVFGMHATDGRAWLRALGAAVAFCFASSFSYIINDIRDRANDRYHRRKKDRPLASGKLSVSTAVAEATVCVVLGFAVASAISSLLCLVIAAYVVLQVCYTLLLKQKALVDVICIAMGFVLRTVSGAVAIGVVVSPWLFVCMFTLCLFMGFCKRYNEIVTIGDMARAENHRNTLIAYTPDLLTHLITVSAGIAVVAFLFYGLADRTVEQFGTNYFVYTLPIVVYAVFRFAMLSMNGSYADPTDLFLHDRVFQMTALLWAVSMMIIICRGRELAGWIQGLY
ncbi:MAG: decaprenyl-phosphate phosphoribosyltransferase [Planctomycetota bacterium]|nr:MAG: decaprenyl-phosphate phosphoribosyltransferase [Planctomycetota bacterium]